jgi:hypothetical protein
MMNTCYWVEWLIEYEKICLKKKNIYICAHRYMVDINTKNQTDVVWLIWEILLKKNNKDNKDINLLKEIGNSALQLFSVKYSRGVVSKRKCLFYFVIQLLCETSHDMTREIFEGQHIESTKEILKNIDTIYADIKKKERTDTNEAEKVVTTNKQKTMDKFNLLNETFLQ